MAPCRLPSRNMTAQERSQHHSSGLSSTAHCNLCNNIETIDSFWQLSNMQYASGGLRSICSKGGHTQLVVHSTLYDARDQELKVSNQSLNHGTDSSICVFRQSAILQRRQSVAELDEVSAEVASQGHCCHGHIR